MGSRNLKKCTFFEENSEDSEISGFLDFVGVSVGRGAPQGHNFSAKRNLWSYDHRKVRAFEQFEICLFEELVSQLDSKVKEIRPELNETWFVRFSSQDDCLKAAEWLTFHGK